jgi:hypothetical protein
MVRPIDDITSRALQANSMYINSLSSSYPQSRRPITPTPNDSDSEDNENCDQLTHLTDSQDVIIILQEPETPER